MWFSLLEGLSRLFVGGFMTFVCWRVYDLCLFEGL